MNIFKRIMTAVKNFFEDPEADMDICIETESGIGSEQHGNEKLLLDVMDQYIESCEGDKSETTLKGYRSMQRNYFENLKKYAIRDVTGQLIQEALDYELEKGRTVKTVKNAFYFLRNVFDYAYLNGEIAEPINFEQIKIGPKEVSPSYC